MSFYYFEWALWAAVLFEILSYVPSCRISDWINYEPNLSGCGSNSNDTHTSIQSMIPKYPVLHSPNRP